jgi:manganese efflux pump family protein
MLYRQLHYPIDEGLRSLLMAIAALATWLVTAGFGSFMLVRWLRRGGLRRGAHRTTHFSPAFVFAHLGLAVGGLVVWIGYLATDSPTLAWIAFADLAAVATLGGVLVRRWTLDGRAAMAAGAQAPAVDLAEQHIPRPPVVLHGIFAVSTVVLVLFSALGVGPA